MSKTCPKDVPKMSQTCPKHVPNMSKTCPKYGSNMSITCSKHVPNMSQTCPKHYLNKYLPLHYVSACGIRPKTQFWLFQHFRHSEGALVCKTKVPSWIFDFHQFSGAHWGGWSEPIRDLFVTFLKMCAISIISVWRPNMVSLWSFIVFTSPSVNNFSYLWQNIQILSQTLTKT